MKKKILLIAVVIVMGCTQLLGGKVMAANIDEGTARQYGAYYMSVMMGGKDIEIGEVSLAYRFMNEDLNIPAAYIFNVAEQGFVIISGSDLWYPILGYSTEGALNVDCMAPSFRWYYESMCEYIVYSQNTGRSLITDVEQEWDELKYQKLPINKESKADAWMMKTKWGQGSTDSATYNKYCPFKMVDGVKKTAYVGCVATAMSQIMRYWEYPVEPMKDTMGYDCYLDDEFYEHVNIDMSEVRYDYSKMPVRLSTNSPESMINATALLCYHVGVSVEMGYGLNGSGAWSKKVPDAFSKIFLYDTMAKLAIRTAADYENFTEDSNYTNEEWATLMRTEIANGRPMYYCGYSRSGSGRDAGAHAFVCDGINPSDSNLFHFNWGWDGQPNVWSDVRNNNVSVGDFNFNFDQGAVINIQPRESVDTVGIEDIETKMMLAFPNPAVGSITIPYELNEVDYACLEIYGVDGRIVERVALNPSEHSIRLDVSKYPAGLYVYKIGNMVRKFVVK